MTSRNQLQGEKLAEKIIATCKLKLSEFSDKQLEELIDLLTLESFDRVALIKSLSEFPDEFNK